MQKSLHLIMVLSILLISLPSCKSKQPPPKKPPVPVTASYVEKKSMPVYIKAIGNVEAYSQVSVKSQISGILTRVHFKEGQFVKKGELLFTIDPAPYEAALKQATANLARDVAQLNNARTEVKRYEELVKKGYISASQFDQIKTNADSLEAAVKADEAIVENARLQLKYCYINSPISGKAGSLIVHEGNLIKANADTPMVIINQIKPIYVTFSVPEQFLPEIKKYMSTGKVKTQVFINKDTEHPVEGILTFIENAVDPDTGTIKLKSIFNNNDNRLWPGQFVDVLIILTIQKDALVIPSKAVMTGQGGQFVYVIKEDLSVENRPVAVSRTIADEAVIEKGLQSGERIVTDGQLRLMPGSKVQVKETTESIK
ncbi:MAG: efflux RND transporter periplasmic adaptor subunit [Nitrospirae bacterium]|nr:efflux RND transporter periplasmic adaptor subunit [Nitrospirota bacterium]